MAKKSVEKVVQVNWRKTIENIRKGETAEFQATAEDGNKIRVAASLLRKKGKGMYSISMKENIVIIKHT